MSTENTAINLSGFTYLCRYCGKSYQLRIDLFNHKWMDHQDEIHRVNQKSESNQDLRDSSQLDTTRNKRKAEETGMEVKKFANTGKYPADCQMEEDEKDEQEREYHEYNEFSIITEIDTNFFDDETEIDIQEEQFFQCSNCGSNFLTLDNLRSHELECDLNNDEESIHQTGTLQKHSPIQIPHAETKVEEVKESVSIQSSYKRPKLTYHCLIALAIKNSPTQTVTSHQLCHFVAKVFPFFEYVVNHNCKKIITEELYRSNLFQKVAVINQGLKGPKFVYGFDLKPKSQLWIESLIQEQCLNNEAAIKSCMRHPENFSRLVSGDSCMPAVEEEDHGGDDKENEEERLLEPKATAFKDLGRSSASFKMSEQQSTIIIDLDGSNDQVDGNDDEDDKENDRMSRWEKDSLQNAEEEAEENGLMELSSSYQRPELTLNCLAGLAIKNSPTQTTTCQQVREFATKVFPYFRYAGSCELESRVKSLHKSNLLKKYHMVYPGQSKPELVYGFDNKAKTKLRFESIIREQCLTKEAVIKSCMERPEDFSRLVSGDLCMLAEEDGGDDEEEEEEENDEKDEEEEHFLKEAPAGDFEGLLSDPLEIAGPQSLITDNLDNIVFKIAGEDRKTNNTKNTRRTEEIQSFERAEESVQAHQQPQPRTFERPKLSFPCIAALALKNSPTQTVTCNEVFEFAAKVFPYFYYAANHNWKISVRGRLNKSNLFKKIEIINRSLNGPKFVYEFDSEPKSQLRIQSLIQDECLINEVAIKNCMRHPEDFFILVSGNLCTPVDEKLDSTQNKRRMEPIQNNGKEAKESVQFGIQPQLSFQQPTLSFPYLVALAIKNSPTQTALFGEICKFVANVFPYFQYAVDHNWKNSTFDVLRRRSWVQKNKIINQRRGRAKLSYGFRLETKSKLEIEIQNHCLNNEASIKSCMRRPEDFSKMVSGDLCLLTEEDGGDDRDTEENHGDDDVEEEKLF